MIGKGQRVNKSIFALQRCKNIDTIMLLGNSLPLQGTRMVASGNVKFPLQGFPSGSIFLNLSYLG
jgi:hypothetical protein